MVLKDRVCQRIPFRQTRLQLTSGMNYLTTAKLIHHILFGKRRGSISYIISLNETETVIPIFS